MIVQVGHLKANLESNNRQPAEALAELERELNLRIRMYPAWIKSRKMDSIQAQERLERLARAAQLLEKAYNLQPVDQALSGDTVAPDDEAAA